MSSFRGGLDNSAALNKNFGANNNSAPNLDFNNLYIDKNAQQGNLYNQHQSQGGYQPPIRGNTMTNAPQPMMMQNNYNNMGNNEYYRSNSMQLPQNYNQNFNPNQQYMSPQQSSQKSHFSSMFKKKNGSSNKIKDEDEDGDAVLMGGSENIVSFNDISGFRKAGGPAYGMNNASDTSPIIPTVLTTGNADITKMNNTSYRKLLTNQKKTALKQFNKQFKEESNGGMPRAMSMQNQPPRASTFQSGQQHPFRPPNAVPGPPPFGSNYGTPYGSRSNSLMNSGKLQQQQHFAGGNPLPQQQQQQNVFPNKAMSMAAGNRAPFMQQPRFNPNNSRANSMQNRNVPSNNMPPTSYLQQQQQLHEKNYQNTSMKNKNNNYPPTQQIPQNPQHQPTPQPQQNQRVPQQQQLQNNEQFDFQQRDSPVETVPQKQQVFNSELAKKPNQQHLSTQAENPFEFDNQEESNFDSDTPKVAVTTTNNNTSPENTHKKSESIKLRPSSALFKGLDEAEIDNSDQELVDNNENAFSTGISHEHKESIVSFTSPTKKTEFSSNQKSFYNIKDQTDTNIFVTANELPIVDEEEVHLNSNENSSIKTSNSKKSNGSTMKKTKNFFKRMSGLSHQSRSNSISEETPNNFKVHSVVKTETSSTEEKINTAANNRKKFTFKASTSSANEMVNGDKGVTNSLSNNNSKLWTDDFNNSGKIISNAKISNYEDIDFNYKRESYHSLFSNDDFQTNFNPSKPQSSPLHEEPQTLEINESVPDTAETNVASLNSNRFSETAKELRKVPSSPSSNYENNNGDVTINNGNNEFTHSSATKVSSKEISDETIHKKVEHKEISNERDNQLHKKLMQEIFLLSEELSESIIRETELERKILSSANRDNDQLPQSAASNNSSITSANSNIGLIDVQLELRKKSKTIVQLIKDLNEERMKRFIAEEQNFNATSGAKPDFVELSYKYDKLTQLCQEKDEIIDSLKEQLHNKK